MSLSSMTGSPIDAAAAFGLAPTAPNPTAIPQAGAPATKEGTIPGQLPEAGANPNGDANAVNLLDAFKVPVDNAGKPIEQKPVVPAVTPMQLPKSEDFANIATQLSQNVKADPELTAAALAGDVDAFNQVMQSMMQQTMQQTINASAHVSHQLTGNQVAVAEERAGGNIQETQAMQVARTTAITESPDFAEGLQAKLLDTTLADLRTKYPTAPGELLGKEAVRLLTQSSAPSQEAAIPAVDWTAQF